MEEKIIQACKIIFEIGDSYDLKEWHETCVKVMDLGLTDTNLKEFINTQPDARLAQFSDGNLAVAAGYIRNFIGWDSGNILYVKEYYHYLSEFMRTISKGE